MRDDPRRLRFEIQARDGAARAGRLLTSHGPVATPAFIPLATRGAVRTLDLGDVAATRLRADPRQHLPPVPLARRRADRRARRPAPVHGLGPGADHRLRRLSGLLARPRQRRRRDQGPAGRLRGRRRGDRDRRARRPLSLLHRRLRAVHGAGGVDGGAGGARLRHRARLRRVHPVSRRPRLHRAIDRAHPPLARSLPRLARRARARDPGGVRDRPGGRARGPAAGVGGGGRRGRGRRAGDRRHARPRQGRDARGAGDDRAAAAGRPRPSTCSGSASPTTCSPGSRSASTSSTAPCPPGSPGTGSRWRRCPSPAFASTSPRPPTRPTTAPLVDGCPCPTCAAHSRAYLHYLARAEAPTAARLLTLHNLTFLERLVAGARAAIESQGFDAYRDRILTGNPPWTALTTNN